MRTAVIGAGIAGLVAAASLQRDGHDVTVYNRSPQPVDEVVAAGATHSGTIADAVRAPVIASGGVGTIDHLVEGIRDGHAGAVLAASIFHFGTYTIAQAKAHMAKAGLAMRLDAAG